jgi:hypothetical protein
VEALYNILSAALSKHDKVWQDAGKARQLRSRLIEILNGDPAASPLGGAHRLMLLIRRSVRPRGYASGFDSPAALLTAFLSIVKLLIQLHHYLKCPRCIV